MNAAVNALQQVVQRMVAEDIPHVFGIPFDRLKAAVAEAQGERSFVISWNNGGTNAIRCNAKDVEDVTDLLDIALPDNDNGTYVMVPTLSETVTRIQREVVAEDRIPTTARSFSELHDYIDANTLGGFCEDGLCDAFITHFGGRVDEAMPDAYIAFVNDAQNAVDSWLRSGGLKYARKGGAA